MKRGLHNAAVTDSILTACLLALTFAATAVGQSNQPPRYSFRCSFSEGHVRRLDKGAFTAAEADKISTEIIFDTGDMNMGRMIANAGAEDVVVLSSPEVTTFLTPGGGTVVVTSVMHGAALSAVAALSSVPAVMSRHVSAPLLGGGSQYFGHCRVLR